MANNMTITSSDGRVDVVQAPDGMQAEAGGDQQFQQGQGHSSDVEDIVSISVAMSAVEKLRDAKDEIELLEIFGIDEDKAHEVFGRVEEKLPGGRYGRDEYYQDAVREVIIDMLSANLGNEDEVVIMRTFESRLADKIRQKEAEPLYNRINDSTESVEG